MLVAQIQLFQNALEAVKTFYDLMSSDNPPIRLKIIAAANCEMFSWALVPDVAYPFVSGAEVITSSDYHRLAEDLAERAAPQDADWFEQALPNVKNPTFEQFLPLALPGINIQEAIKALTK